MGANSSLPARMVGSTTTSGLLPVNFSIKPAASGSLTEIRFSLETKGSIALQSASDRADLPILAAYDALMTLPGNRSAKYMGSIPFVISEFQI